MKSITNRILVFNSNVISNLRDMQRLVDLSMLYPMLKKSASFFSTFQFHLMILLHAQQHFLYTFHLLILRHSLFMATLWLFWYFLSVSQKKTP